MLRRPRSVQELRCVGRQHNGKFAPAYYIELSDERNWNWSVIYIDEVEHM